MFELVLHVFKKEITDLFRDKKTWTTSILLPVLLYPAIMFFVAMIMNSAVEEAQSYIPLAIEDSSGIIEEVIAKQEQFQIIEGVTNYKEAISAGEIRFYVEVPANAQQAIEQMEPVELYVYYDRTNQKAVIAYSMLRELLQSTSNTLLQERLEGLGLSTSAIEPLLIKEVSVATKEQEAGAFLSFIIPLFLIIACVSGGLAAATDLVAGEKERGTLEALVTTPVGGSPIMIGKMLTVMLMSFISALLSFGGLAIVFMILPSMAEGTDFAGVVFTPDFFLISMIVLLLTSAMIAAIQLSLSTLAKSFKEAQTYNTPLIIIALLPGYLLMMTPATEIPVYYFFLPIVNVVAIFKEVLAGVMLPLHLVYVLGSSILYLCMAVALFAYLFRKESLVLKV